MNLTELELKINQFANKINAPKNLLPTFDFPRGDGTPNIEIDDSGLFHYVISKRGNEYDRKITNDLNNLLYWVFSNVTFSIATTFELNNRIEDQDFRRIMFDKQEKLLGILDQNWKELEKNEHQNILKQHPFDDLSGLRAKYCRELRIQGLSEFEIDKLAFDKFPKNES